MANDGWATPQWLYDGICDAFGVTPTLDVCASVENAKCEKFYTEEQNGLKLAWDRVNWGNPPYSNPMPWVERAITAMDFRVITFMLVKHDHTTRWWKLARASRNCSAYLIDKRIRSDGAPSVAPFPSTLLMFNNRYSASHIGILEIVKEKIYVSHF